MKTWTMQCSYRTYFDNSVIVEAETLEEALQKAIEEANNDPDWKSSDYAGQTFVEAVAEGDNVDPWKGYQSAIPVPERFTERGETPLVTVTVEGGVVQHVSTENGPVRVQVRDYDTEGAKASDPRIHTDEHGDLYELAEW